VGKEKMKKGDEKRWKQEKDEKRRRVDISFIICWTAGGHHPIRWHSHL
jgi:hypothetical protein